MNFYYRINIRPSHQEIIHRSWWSRRKSRSQSSVRHHFVPLSNNLVESFELRLNIYISLQLIKWTHFYPIYCLGENEIESSANEKRHNSQDPNDYETSSAAKRSKFNRPILSSVLPKPRTESYPASEKVLEEF